MRLLSAILFFLCCTVSVFSQSPAASYYKGINQAEKYITYNKLDSAVYQYERTLEDHAYPFCRNIEQAFFVSCYARNKESAELFLTKCVGNGLTKNQFAQYVSLWSTVNPGSQINVDYQKLRCEHLKNIDTTQLFQYMKLDVERDILIDHLRSDSVSKAHYFKEMKQVRDAYIFAVKTYGYPSERKTGAFFSRENLKQFPTKDKGELVYRMPIESWGYQKSKYKYVVLSDKDMQIVSLKPGNWFLTHYINPDVHTVVDSELFSILETGFNSLNLDPLVIVGAMESTRQLENEFALSYYSQLWAYRLKFDYRQKFGVADDIRTVVDANRKKYYIRTVAEEEALYRALYKMKTGKEMSPEISEEEAREVLPETKLFLTVF